MLKDYQIQNIKKQYPPGTKVELESMAGEQQMPCGLRGEVKFVDDAGQIHCIWSNGSTLALVPNEDSFHKIPQDIDLKAPFYRYNKTEARNTGCFDVWHNSHTANKECARYIDSLETGLMAVAYKDNIVDRYHNYCKSVIEKFGYQRVMCVLASTIREKNSDGRFSRENKEWARNQLGILEKEQTRKYLVDQVHPGALDIFTNSVRKQYESLGLYTAEHCIADSRRNLDYEDRVLVLSPKHLKEEYWQPKNQIFYATSGFGCDPTASGRAVYGKYLIDGEETRLNRADLIGVMKDECIPKWARDTLEQIQQSDQEQKSSDQSKEMGMNM